MPGAALLFDQSINSLHQFFPVYGLCDKSVGRGGLLSRGQKFVEILRVASQSRDAGDDDDGNLA